MKVPILYVFNISHYCEKARRALEHFGIAHEVRHVMVGTHRRSFAATACSTQRASHGACDRFPNNRF
ncbi:MAG: glutathione S-transferase N-terminal domain-containing protein [Burkholderiales bacterium]